MLVVDNKYSFFMGVVDTLTVFSQGVFPWCVHGLGGALLALFTLFTYIDRQRRKRANNVLYVCPEVPHYRTLYRLKPKSQCHSNFCGASL